MDIILEDHLGTISSPANLVINDQIKEFRKNCQKMGCVRPYHHFAFGQSPFPPPPSVIEALSLNASKHDYLPTAGLESLRELVAKYYKQNFNLSCSLNEIIISPGSKEMISMILAVINGSVLIPVPSWVSYLPQAKILKKEVVSIETNFKDNYKLTPELLLKGVSKSSHDQRILILNHPHNPTGAMYTGAELEELADVCRNNNIVIIADEIYASTSFNMNSFNSMGKVFPEGTIVTGGLSKDRSAGGYRLGVGIFPTGHNRLIEDTLKIAGSTYSCVATPIQYAALEAYSMSEAVESHITSCREINAMVGKYITKLYSQVPEIQTSKPEGGFYLLMDLNEYREQFLKLGINTCSNFAENLLKIEHTALLPGEALLMEEGNFSLRCSYVDYDGSAALKSWYEKPPANETEVDAFVQKHCPLIINGVKHISRYLEQIQQGNYPKHY